MKTSGSEHAEGYKALNEVYAGTYKNDWVVH